MTWRELNREVKNLPKLGLCKECNLKECNISRCKNLTCYNCTKNWNCLDYYAITHQYKRMIYSDSQIEKMLGESYKEKLDYHNIIKNEIFKLILFPRKIRSCVKSRRYEYRTGNTEIFK